MYLLVNRWHLRRRRVQTFHRIWRPGIRHRVDHQARMVLPPPWIYWIYTNLINLNIWWFYTISVSVLGLVNMNIPFYQSLHAATVQILHLSPLCNFVGYWMLHVLLLSDTSARDPYRFQHNRHPRKVDPWSSPTRLKNTIRRKYLQSAKAWINRLGIQLKELFNLQTCF